MKVQVGGNDTEGNARNEGDKTKVDATLQELESLQPALFFGGQSGAPPIMVASAGRISGLAAFRGWALEALRAPGA